MLTGVFGRRHWPDHSRSCTLPLIRNQGRVTLAAMSSKGTKSKIGRRRELALTSNEQEYLQKRLLLLEAAGRIFREKGYEGASMSDFARAIGIDRASVYYYISGKAELFQEMVQHAVRANVEMIEAIRDGDLPPAERIRAFIIGLMRSYEEHFPYLYAYVQEDMVRIADGRNAWAKVMRRLGERFDAAALAIVQHGLESGAIRKNVGSARLITLGIVGMCNWSHRWFRPTGGFSGEAIGESFSAVVLNGILAGPSVLHGSPGFDAAECAVQESLA